ncbi:uncharacterized protein LOC141586481 isoform X2 [Silene latifolia]|uniref:uncharacterized protein LOC141586481 isoform X2 n=1 Tax=Silene latifolia TaxID=37657 RepID=UPI003D76CAE2
MNSITTASFNFIPITRCAAEYLQMIDKYCENNLASRTDDFLSQVALANLFRAIIVLKTCEDLLPMALDLALVQRSIDVISIKDDNVDCEASEETSVDWDCSLHLPLFISKTERASIERCLEEFTIRLEESGADISSLAMSLRKPLRPLWISQKSVIWLNEVPDHDSWNFTPIILVSASSQDGFIQHRGSTEFSWNYIPGAGDDEESWARGLTPILFWSHVSDLINCEPNLCNRKVAEIVEADRVYRAQRGLDAPQISVKSQKSSGSNEHEKLPLHSKLEAMKIGECSSSKGNSAICWLGSTNVAVSTTQAGILLTFFSNFCEVSKVFNKCCSEPDLPRIDFNHSIYGVSYFFL